MRFWHHAYFSYTEFIKFICPGIHVSGIPTFNHIRGRDHTWVWLCFLQCEFVHVTCMLSEIFTTFILQKCDLSKTPDRQVMMQCLAIYSWVWPLWVCLGCGCNPHPRHAPSHLIHTPDWSLTRTCIGRPGARSGPIFKWGKMGPAFFFFEDTYLCCRPSPKNRAGMGPAKNWFFASLAPCQQNELLSKSLEYISVPGFFFTVSRHVHVRGISSC